MKIGTNKFVGMTIGTNKFVGATTGVGGIYSIGTVDDSLKFGTLGVSEANLAANKSKSKPDNNCF
jgi:hypothetical protein